MTRGSRWALGLILAMGLPFLVGCSALGTGGETSIQHIVVCWMKDPRDTAARARLIAAGDELRGIPGVSQLRVGTPLDSARPGVDASYDVIYTMTFANNAAYTTYLGHPTHKRLLDEVLTPNVERLAVYDFQPRARRN